MLDNRMVIDEEWDEIEYGVKRGCPADWDDLPGFVFDMEVDDG